MAAPQAETVLRHIHDLVATQHATTLHDSDLLERFTHAQDEAAFTTLVRRHGPLVLGVCRRVLGNSHDAEDAFQATFLVLARKAASICNRASVSSWLYQVAYRVSLKGRVRAATRERLERRAEQRAAAEPLDELTGQELLAVLDDELHRLPESYRAPLILCHLESRTCDEAARQLGCSTRTVKRRLELARRCLHARLARRGLTLSTALMVGGLSHAAAQTALAPALIAAAAQAAHAGAAPAATTLADSVVGAMFWSRVRSAVAVVLLAGATLVFGALAPQADSRRQLEAAPRAEPQPAPRQQPAAPQAEAEGQTIVAGQIRGADGNPLAAADVAVIGRTKHTGRGGDLLTEQTLVLGQGRTDAGGQFRLIVPRPSTERFWNVHLLARAAGHGLAQRKLSPGREKLEATLTLSPERPLRGQLVDLQGQSAAGVRVRVATLGKSVNGEPAGVHFFTPPSDLAAWPPSVTTDRQGRYVIRGLSEAEHGTLTVTDERFAPLWIPFGPLQEDKEVNRALAPAQVVQGRVLAADTGKPVPHALLTIYSADEEFGNHFGLGGKTDAEGRYRISANSGKILTVSAHPPPGAPYLPIEQRFRWEAGKVKKQLDIKVPRGVVVRGKVIEAGSGKLVAGAAVQFWPRRANNPNFRREVLSGWQSGEESGPDGTFQITVLPGPGHLLILGPDGDYIHEEVGSTVLYNGRPGGERYYPDALVKLDLPAGAGPKDITVTLRRGVTVKGNLVGPDGQPVTGKALMICRLHVTPLNPYWRFPVEVRDGRFELHGLDPDRSYPVFFLEPERQWGTVVDLSGKQAGAAVTVRLQPCGKATARFVGAAGKPAAGHRPWLEIIVTPGARRFDREADKKGLLLADGDNLANIDRHNYWNGPVAGDDGRCTFPALIPGVTYQLTRIEKGAEVVGREFRVEAGKTLDLGEINTGQSE
jgi:RNA polymerase sigma factor (sigma-70 family)